MKLTNILNEVFKKPTRKYDYGCVMVGLNIDTDKWTEIQKLINDDDIYVGDENDNGGYGRELDPHVTILFGIHEDVPDKDVEDIISTIKKPNGVLTNVSSFKNKMFDVLKFDVDSDDLHKLNKRFTKLPHTTDFPNYHPHCTLAYIKSGNVDKYVKVVNEYIKENGVLDINFNEVLYSKPDGSKKNYKI